MTELETFGAALEVMPDAVLVVDERGRIVAANARAEELTGYRREQLVGQSVEKLVPPDTVGRHGAHRAEYFASAHARPMGTGLDIRVLRRDGREVPADIALSPLELDGRRLAMASVRDISERRRIEEDLRLSEERLRLLVDGVTDYAIFMLDSEGRVASWNQGAERIKGYTAGEILGRHFSLFYPPSASRGAKSERALKTAAERGRYEEEGWRIRKDGARFWANVVITPLRDSAGELRGFAKITRDVSAQRRQREQIDSALAVAQAMLGGQGVPEVMELVAQRARKLVDARLALVIEPGPDDALEVSVAVGPRAGRVVGSRLGADERSLSRQVLRTGRPVLVADIRDDPRANQRVGGLAAIHSAICVPIAQADRAFGVLVVGNQSTGGRFDAEDIEPLTFLATQASLALEHARIQEELRRLALVDERDRIGRELHDGAIQAIFAIGMSLEGLAARTEDAALAERLRATVAQLDGVIKDLRNYIYGLRPSLVRGQDLEQALRQLVDDFAAHSGVTAVADIEPAAADRLSSIAGEVVLLAGEALSNVGRHAEALTCRLTLRMEDGGVALEVEDDGRGFDLPRADGTGQGLRNLRERTARLGGEAAFDSTHGEGTTVTFHLPVEPRG